MEIRKLKKKEFPPNLLQIPDPPDELWLGGQLPDPAEKLVYLSVVGSRKSTSYGREVCRRFINGLRGYPIVIVSGFAIGIDTIAHRSAMETGLRTIVFPGSGLSERVLYPKNNQHLVDKVLSSGGCFLSEFEPDFEAIYWSFPQRNRLMAGISKATLVIEAAERSGTLITARLALEYNRDVLAVPGQIFTPGYAGTNRLLREGATLVTCSEDILEALDFTRPDEGEKQTRIHANLSTEEKSVAKILCEPLPRDELLRAMSFKMNMDTSRANILLSAMEIREIIKEEMGEIRLS